MAIHATTRGFGETVSGAADAIGTAIKKTAKTVAQLIATAWNKGIVPAAKWAGRQVVTLTHWSKEFTTETIVPALEKAGKWVTDTAWPQVKLAAHKLFMATKRLANRAADFFKDSVVPAVKDGLTLMKKNPYLVGAAALGTATVAAAAATFGVRKNGALAGLGIVATAGFAAGTAATAYHGIKNVKGL
jgi:hypothetical protein